MMHFDTPRLTSFLRASASAPGLAYDAQKLQIEQKAIVDRRSKKSPTQFNYAQQLKWKFFWSVA
jgi:hypothetical protein